MEVHFPHLTNDMHLPVMRKRKFGLQKRLSSFALIGFIGLMVVWFI